MAGGGSLISAAGVEFSIDRAGVGPPVVFIHGLEGDLHSWDSIFAALGGKYDKLRYDLRGCGRSSDPPDVEFDHAEDLAALLNAAGIQRASLVGVSKGGAIALNFALDHPHRVDRLVLISPALVAWEWSDEWKELWLPMVERARAGRLDEARELWWRHPLFDNVRDSALGPRIYESIMCCSGAEWIGDRQKHRLPDVDRLPFLEAPTLLLTGEQDMPDFRLIADLVAGSCERLKRVDVPHAGHLLHLEQPLLCAAETAGFLPPPD